MVIQDGGFKKDPLNQTEMVSLLLDDDQIAKASELTFLNMLKRRLRNAIAFVEIRMHCFS